MECYNIGQAVFPERNAISSIAYCPFDKAYYYCNFYAEQKFPLNESMTPITIKMANGRPTFQLKGKTVEIKFDSAMLRILGISNAVLQ